MKEAYCSHGVVELLKEKGFDIHSPANSYAPHHNDDGTSELYITFTHQLACAWLRKKFHIFIEVNVCIDLNGRYHYSYSILDKECRYIRKGYTYFDWKYEDAIEVALKYALENLI